MQLSDLQQYFQDYIFNIENENSEKIKSAIAIPPADSISERLAIYADGYEGRLCDALEKIFPALKKSTSEELFYDWCCEYIYSCPSKFFSLSKIGDQFSLFLKNKDLLLQAEIAALELAIHSAIEAANAKVLTQKILENIPQDKWGEIIFESHPSVQINTAYHDVIDIYESLMKENKKNAEIYEVKVSPNTYRVWRKGIQVYYLKINNIENIFLGSIQQQLGFGEICEKLAEHISEEEVGNYALSQLLTWIQDEVITGVKVPL
jgi:hypothetical protein